MTKNIMLATAALGLIAFAGQATAHTISFRTTGDPTDIDAGSVNTIANFDPTTTDQTKYGRSLVGLYLIAEEALGSALGSGTLALRDQIGGDGTPGNPAGQLPSGNNLYTISLSNATFGTAVPQAAVSGTGCTAVLSSGGAPTDSSVTFIVSTSGAACTGFDLSVPVRPTTSGTVTVTTNLRTEQNNPIDGGLATFDAIFAIDAFQPAFRGDLAAAGAEADTIALLASPTYTTLGGDNILGKTAIYVDTRAERSLDPTDTNVNVGDVVDADFTVTGDFSAFDGAAGIGGNPSLTNAANTPVACDTATTTVVTCLNRQADVTQLLSSKPNGRTFRVTPDGGVIEFSNYSAALDYDLTPGDFAAQPVAGTANNFETIEREGTNVILPWMNDTTIATNNGSSNTVRVGNMSANPARVSARVRNNNVAAQGAGYTDQGIQLIGTAPARGEVQITTQTLTNAVGMFGRGDIELIIEAAPADITTRRYLVRNGVTTEVSNGSIASEQTPDLTTDIQ